MESIKILWVNPDHTPILTRLRMQRHEMASVLQNCGGKRIHFFFAFSNVICSQTMPMCHFKTMLKITKSLFNTETLKFVCKSLA